MERCETCKFWQRSKSEQGSEFGLRRCKAVPMFWDSMEWNEEYTGRRVLPSFNDTKAFVQDGSDYFAKLLTMPDFGCVMHVSANG